MPIESGVNYISDLNPLNPTDTDPLSGGDNHLRMIKDSLKKTFPNITGAVTKTHTEINKLVTTDDYGTGKGIDADKLDGAHGTSFVRNDNGAQTLAGNLTCATPGNFASLGLDPAATTGKGRTVLSHDGVNDRSVWYHYDQTEAYAAVILNYNGGSPTLTINGVGSVWTQGNDGPGSGLDADTVDGFQAAALAKWSGGTFTGAVSFNSNVAVTGWHRVTGRVYLDGGATLGASFDGGGQRLTNIGAAVGLTDAMNVNFGDARYAGLASSVGAGNGLTGGGYVKDGPSLTLGTPSAISTATTNSVTSGSHTHTLTLTATDILARTAQAGFGGGGTYALLSKKSNVMTAGETLAGSSLRIAGVEHANNNEAWGRPLYDNWDSAAAPSGTWRCMSAASVPSTSYVIGLWLRIS